MIGCDKDSYRQLKSMIMLMIDVGLKIPGLKSQRLASLSGSCMYLL